MSAVPAAELQKDPVSVLIVDDEESIRRSLEVVLEDEGFQVLLAESGEQALKLLQEQTPALVLLDIWMPGSDGIKTLEQIKARHPELPVVMMSGHATIRTALQATRIGAADFVEKPLDLEGLLAVVRRALAKIDPAPAEMSDEQRFFLDAQVESGQLNSVAFRYQGLRGRPVRQRTLAQSAVLYGHGVHSGRKSGLLLEPLPPNSGIHFSGVAGLAPLPAFIDFVDSTGWATALRQGPSYISTIEHIMSVLHVYGISNLLLKCNEEVPVMDGSALEFCRLIDRVGLVEQEGDWYEIAVDRVLRVGSESEFIQIEAADNFVIEYTLKYPEPVGRQFLRYEVSSGRNFQREIAPARTFGFVKDISALQKQGLAQGGRFDNFVLIGDDGAINDKLRFPDEAVRHKILDLLGDFYLLGRPYRGKVTACMTGHSDNIALLKLLRAELES